MTVTRIVPRIDFLEHLLRLGPADRRLRFCAAVSDQFIIAYVSTMKTPDDFVLGFYDEAETLRGAAHVSIFEDLADLGLSVDEGFRGQGIGTLLLDEAISEASKLGATRFSSQCLAHNQWMTRIVKARGFELIADRDVTLASLPLGEFE